MSFPWTKSEAIDIRKVYNAGQKVAKSEKRNSSNMAVVSPVDAHTALSNLGTVDYLLDAITDDANEFATLALNLDCNESDRERIYGEFRLIKDTLQRLQTSLHQALENLYLFQPAPPEVDMNLFKTINLPPPP